MTGTGVYVLMRSEGLGSLSVWYCEWIGMSLLLWGKVQWSSGRSLLQRAFVEAVLLGPLPSWLSLCAQKNIWPKEFHKLIGKRCLQGHCSRQGFRLNATKVTGTGDCSNRNVSISFTWILVETVLTSHLSFLAWRFA